MSSESKVLTDYFFGNGDVAYDSDEVSRLNGQYNLIKALFEYPQPVPPGIDISQVSRVIDVGAGTGAWVRDFMSQPSVRDRDVEAFACDINTAKFPRNDEPEVKKITFFQHDVTKPFPDEFLGTFDLINLSFLCYGLTRQGWKSALQNVYSLLKPGGNLFLREPDMLSYNRENPSPSDLQESDVIASFQGTSNIAKINRVFVTEALKRGFVAGLSYHLQRMLEEASFKVIFTERLLLPFGNSCDFYKSKNGASLLKHKDPTIPSYVSLMNSITIASMKAGNLELADGTRITTEEQRLVLMEELRQCVIEGGCMIVSDWVGVRPSESHEALASENRNPLGAQHHG